MSLCIVALGGSARIDPARLPPMASRFAVAKGAASAPRSMRAPREEIELHGMKRQVVREIIEVEVNPNVPACERFLTRGAGEAAGSCSPTPLVKAWSDGAGTRTTRGEG